MAFSAQLSFSTSMGSSEYHSWDIPPIVDGSSLLDYQTQDSLPQAYLEAQFSGNSRFCQAAL